MYCLLEQLCIYLYQIMGTVATSSSLSLPVSLIILFFTPTTKPRVVKGGVLLPWPDPIIAWIYSQFCQFTAKFPPICSQFYQFAVKFPPICNQFCQFTAKFPPICSQFCQFIDKFPPIYSQVALFSSQICPKLQPNLPKSKVNFAPIYQIYPNHGQMKLSEW